RAVGGDPALERVGGADELTRLAGARGRSLGPEVPVVAIYREINRTRAGLTDAGHRNLPQSTSRCNPPGLAAIPPAPARARAAVGKDVLVSPNPAADAAPEPQAVVTPLSGA